MINHLFTRKTLPVRLCGHLTETVVCVDFNQRRGFFWSCLVLGHMPPCYRNRWGTCTEAADSAKMALDMLHLRLSILYQTGPPSIDILVSPAYEPNTVLGLQTLKKKKSGPDAPIAFPHGKSFMESLTKHRGRRGEAAPPALPPGPFPSAPALASLPFMWFMHSSLLL